LSVLPRRAQLSIIHVGDKTACQFLRQLLATLPELDSKVMVHIPAFLQAAQHLLRLRGSASIFSVGAGTFVHGSQVLNACAQPRHAVLHLTHIGLKDRNTVGMFGL
jgi:hypothetical protein